MILEQLTFKKCLQALNYSLNSHHDIIGTNLQAAYLLYTYIYEHMAVQWYIYVQTNFTLSSKYKCSSYKEKNVYFRTLSSDNKQYYIPIKLNVKDI